ncbi:MAG: YifB family Mg chelatase-like AAA ATPase [Oscillospiraceae bacterium]|nr:YifB family Mg chelatase-like AAA ATPase [Oscillospiraceae bacterium]
MFAITNSIGLFGMNAFSVTVEAEMFKGHPQFDISGLPDTCIKESRDRVRSALASLGVEFPKQQVLINLAPANVRKSGTSFDLAMIVSLMQSLGMLPPEMPERVFIGELGLNGTLHGTRGVLPMVMHARKEKFREIYVPKDNLTEAAVVGGIDVYGVENIQELFAHLTGVHPLTPAPVIRASSIEQLENMLDFSDVHGQEVARQGVEIAAAGGHNILLIGAPGSGKSMLAKRIPSILPPMTPNEVLDTTNVYSVAGQLPPDRPLIKQRPFRAPHHTVSSAGLVGGGSIPAPGEISLAHNGVLFLDELAEFERSTLEILRQPLENHEVSIARVAGSAVYPCNFMLVAAMNPCPCGYYGSATRQCTCTQRQVRSYLGKISGPLLDRFDLQVDVDTVPFEKLASEEPEESSASIRERVTQARLRQIKRFSGTRIYSNGMLPDRLLPTYCKLDEPSERLMEFAHRQYGISARTHYRVIRVALTVADLRGHEHIERSDVATALQFRGLESNFLYASRPRGTKSPVQ